MGTKEKLLLSALTVGAFVIGTSVTQAKSFVLEQVNNTPANVAQFEGSCGAGSCESGSCGSKDDCDPQKDENCKKKKSDNGSCGSGSCG